MSTALVILTVCLPAAVSLLGLALTTIGLRGRRIDDHPLCRKCGFDLFGSSGSARCPECGNELIPGRVRIGHRARRRRPLVLGLGLVIPLVLLLIAGGVAVYRGADWEKDKPFWLLLREGDWRAVAELNRREFVAKSLSPSQERKLIAATLAVQGDIKRPWLPGWGDLIEAMQSVGKVSDHDWQRYARQATIFSVTVRPVLRRGDPLPVEISHSFRSATNSRLFMWTRIRRISIDGVDVEGVHDLGSGNGAIDQLNGLPDAGSFGDAVPTSTDALKPVANGHHDSTVEFSVAMHAGSSSFTAPVAASWVERRSLPITLVAADAHTVEMVNDPSLASKIEACASVWSNHLRDGALGLNADGIQGSVSFAHPPIPLAFDVYLRDRAKREWKVDYPIDVRPSEQPSWGLTGQVPRFDSDQVDLVFRSSAAVARRTIDMNRIWSGTIVLHNIKVIWYPPTTRPWQPR